MAIAAPPPPLPTPPCRAPPANPYLRFLLRSPAAAAMARLTLISKPPTPITPLVDSRGEHHHALPNPSPQSSKIPLLSAAAASIAVVAIPRPAFALSGGSAGGCSDSGSSYGGDDSTDSISWWGNKNKADDQNSTHESVGTAASPPPPPVTVNPYARFCSNVALASGVIGALFLIARFCPSTHVIKLQVALRGNAAVKSLQKDLNKIAERTDDSNERWYKFILTETISSLRCHKDCCISTSLTVDVKYSIDWKDHFEKISMEERSKFDEETLSNLQGIKRKKVYSKKTDGSKNEYIVLTILVAANGILDFPQVIRSVADLETALAKLNSTPETDLWGMHVLWAPQDEDDILSAERIQKDYPYQKPLSSL